MGTSYKTLHLFGWHGVVMFGKRSVLCETRLLIRVWEALEYLRGYERDTPIMYYMFYLYKSWLFEESHGEKMVLFPMPMRRGEHEEEDSADSHSCTCKSLQYVVQDIVRFVR